MGKIMELKYLPIQKIYVTTPSMYAETFKCPLIVFAYDFYGDYDTYTHWCPFLQRAQRKLLLKVQRHYRKMIQDRRENFEDFILGVYDDVTMAEDLVSGNYLFCRLILIPREEWPQWK